MIGIKQLRFAPTHPRVAQPLAAGSREYGYK